MAEIPLSNGGVALIDDEDLERVSGHAWRSHPADSLVDCWYAMTTARIADGEWKTLYLHRLVMSAQPGEEIDHIGCDGLDCRKSNLRRATRSQQNMNRRLCSRNSSGFKGASWDRFKRNWKAYIQHNGVFINLGGFKTVEEAALVYDAKARELFGEWARLNFPKQGERGCR